MADIREIPTSVRLFLKAYRWRRNDPVPWSPPRKPLSEAKIALVSTAGLVAPGQPPFDDGIRGGDWSFREIAADTDPRTLIETHRSKSFDHSGIAEDANLAMPLDRLHELAREGVIGSVNGRHFSLMGSITAPGRLMKESAPAVAAALKADQVDVVLLVPV
ncbi:MAG TPA: glycine/sarcosine/betaine reductase selenoprotein B family protein [Thermoanaerobaculia bacterium]